MRYHIRATVSLVKDREGRKRKTGTKGTRGSKSVYSHLRLSSVDIRPTRRRRLFLRSLVGGRNSGDGSGLRIPGVGGVGLALSAGRGISSRSMEGSGWVRHGKLQSLEDRRRLDISTMKSGDDERVQ